MSSASRRTRTVVNLTALPSINADQIRAPAPTVPGMLRDLRSNHAGEAGAVMIYRGILAGSSDSLLRRFAASHMATELNHLALMETLVPASKRSILLPAWKLAGWLTGFLPALVGSRAVYGTIEAVEIFVVRHYQEQIDNLAPSGASGTLRSILLRCQQDELHHRDEARAAQAEAAGRVLRAWTWAVDLGSRAAVVVARRV